MGLWVGREGWLETGALNDVRGHIRAFEILWAEDHPGSRLLKEGETDVRRL